MRHGTIYLLSFYIKPLNDRMLEIKTDDGKGLRARAIVGNTSRCGVCDMVLLDGQQFFMLDDPYNCVVHNTCINFMSWDGKLRAQGTDRDAMSKEISDDEKTLGDYMQKAHWPTLRLPTAVREAWMRFYFRGLMLRQTYDLQPKRDALLRKLATALNLLPAADLPQPLQKSVDAPSLGSAVAASQTKPESAEKTTTSSPLQKSPSPSLGTERASSAEKEVDSAGDAVLRPAAAVQSEFRGNVFAP